MQTIVSVLLYLGLIQSPSQVTTSADQTTVSASTSVDGTPVIIDIQEF